MHAPMVGPAHPYNKDGIAAGRKNHRAGHVEDHNMAPFHFDDQYNTFHSRGYAAAPETAAMVGDQDSIQQHKGDTAYAAEGIKRRKTAAEAASGAVLDPQGRWTVAQRQPWADKTVEPARPTAEQMEWLEQEGFLKDEKDKKQEDDGRPKNLKERQEMEEKTHFHGKQAVNAVTGRSWVDPPKDQKTDNEYCYMPKRLIHTWSGHTKGVNAIRFFPNTGHLLLSAGLDGKIKIWDVMGAGKCMRTYMGFTKGVRDINFSNDGRRFLSSSYDKVIKLWDTETGQVIRTIGEGKMFFTAKFHPDDGKQNVLMAGCQDKKVYQWDMNTGDLVQEYDYHLSAVNTITFVDEGRRFVTTSDDKTIRVWEYGIPVQIKYIADPGMHSIPAVELHPNGQWFCGTSLDNQIVTYSAKDRFRMNRKKTFKGHSVSGYACQPAFSADGRYVLSGDGEGKLWVWDWKSTKAFRSFKAHESVAIGCIWHPLESSKVATCGWDGLIKYWD